MGRFFFFRWNPPLGHFLFSIHIVITLYTVAFSLANSLSVRSHRSAITKNYSSRHPGKLQAFQFHSLELGVVIHKLIVLDDACPVFRFASFHTFVISQICGENLFSEQVGKRNASTESPDIFSAFVVESKCNLNIIIEFAGINVFLLESFPGWCND